MKVKILTYLAKHPHSRRREIAHGLRVWQCDISFLRAMHELLDAGLIVETEHKDIGNMDFYFTYEIRKR